MIRKRRSGKRTYVLGENCLLRPMGDSRKKILVIDFSKHTKDVADGLFARVLVYLKCERTLQELEELCGGRRRAIVQILKQISDKGLIEER